MKGFADAASGKMNGFPKAAVVDNLPPIFVDCLQRLSKPVHVAISGFRTPFMTTSAAYRKISRSKYAFY
jgi:hypothetical protein